LATPTDTVWVAIQVGQPLDGRTLVNQQSAPVRQLHSVCHVLGNWQGGKGAMTEHSDLDTMEQFELIREHKRLSILMHNTFINPTPEKSAQFGAYYERAMDVLVRMTVENIRLTSDWIQTEIRGKCYKDGRPYKLYRPKWTNR
jgi:hypothetical protein